jgi:DNA polymerase I-like protein with 3'-5' exonuclease and polymerase domains
MHVHDEIVIEVEKGKAENAFVVFNDMMREAPAWAAGFPLYAECKTMERYGK